MIVKMIILRLLGSRDDKEKIGVARPEGPPLRGFSTHRCNEHRSCELGFGTGLTGIGCFTLTGVMYLEVEEIAGVLQAPVKPTIKAK